jgi:hypothetical protein
LTTREVCEQTKTGTESRKVAGIKSGPYTHKESLVVSITARLLSCPKNGHLIPNKTDLFQFFWSAFGRRNNFFGRQGGDSTPADGFWRL